MELDSTTLYECTMDHLIQIQKLMIEYKALYIETKRELDSLKESQNIELGK